MNLKPPSELKYDPGDIKVRETGTVGSASSFDGEISYGTDNL
jgi:hypothetical protein